MKPSERIEEIIEEQMKIFKNRASDSDFIHTRIWSILKYLDEQHAVKSSKNTGIPGKIKEFSGYMTETLNAGHLEKEVIRDIINDEDSKMYLEPSYTLDDKEIEELSKVIKNFKKGMSDEVFLMLETDDFSKYLIKNDYSKHPKSNELMALDEEKLYELISKHNTDNPDRFYNPKAMNEDKQLAHDICYKFGQQKATVLSVDSIIHIIEPILIKPEHRDSVSYELLMELSQAIHNELIKENKNDKI